jgi:hypothetical protein
MKKIRLVAFAVIGLLSASLRASAQEHVTTYASAPFFRFSVSSGDVLETIFERTAYQTAAHRVSGYAIYSITSASTGRAEYRADVEYYGIAHVIGRAGGVEQTDQGLLHKHNGKYELTTDSSALAYNSWIWGTPPEAIAPGTTWTYSIPAAWELGPSGSQTVTVLSVDPTNERVVLERKGSGSGAPLGEDLTEIDGVMPAWGTTTWKGIAIVARGVVESDEITVRHEILVPASRTSASHTVQSVEQVEFGLVPADGSAP